MHKLIKVDIVEGKPSVTSLQVAEAFEKEHKNVLADVRGTMSKCSELFNGLNFQLVDYFDGKGERRPMYALSKDGFLMLAMGYNTSEAMKIKEAYITRFNEMEEQLRSTMPVLPNFKDPIAAAEAWLVSERSRLAEQARADYYQHTKAEIGSRREATSMATASAAVRKANNLEDQLGFGKRYRQVKAIPWLLNVFANSRGMYSVVGKTLKRISSDLGLHVEKIPSPEYPEGVNAYHVDAISAFKIDLDRQPSLLNKYRKIEEEIVNRV